MATRKSQPQKGGAAKKAAKKSASAAAPKLSNLPPYGEPIRQAIARGDAGEMKRVAASARKYVSDVQAALDKLDQALGSLKK
jgi:Domain of unknown function (DUF1843)